MRLIAILFITFVFYNNCQCLDISNYFENEDEAGCKSQKKKLFLI